MRRDAGSSAYRAQCEVLVEGRLDAGELEEAVRRAAERHEILRTSFQTLHGKTFPVQVIAEEASPLWRSYDLTGRDEREQNLHAAEVFAEMARRDFDLHHGPLFHASQTTLSPERRLLHVNLPALCADAVTLAKLADEIVSVCGARLGGGNLPEPLQHADLSEWQNELLESDHARAGLEYWRRSACGPLVNARLPLEAHVASSYSVFEPSLLSTEVESDVVAASEAFAAGRGVSVETVLLACWYVTLYRLTGHEAVAVARTFDNRGYQELEDALGPFAKSIPVACRLDGEFAFVEVVRRVAEAVRDAEKWQECFTWESAPEAEGASPVGFSFERLLTRRHGSASFRLRRQYVCIDRFRLKLTCVIGADGLAAEFHYDPALIPAGYARHIADCFHGLLESALSRPDDAIQSLRILPAAELRKLSAQEGATRAGVEGATTIHRLFEARAERHPERVALVCEDLQLTYAGLNARANRLAHYLRRLGVGPESRVGLYLNRSADVIVAMLGTLKAGGAYVPLDTEHPPARLARQLVAADVKVLLTQEALSRSLPEFGGALVYLDGDGASWLAGPPTNPRVAGAPDDLAYVIYTSGSTGVPKGVGVSHGSLVNYSRYICRRLGLDDAAGDEALSFAVVSTLSADLCNTSIYPALVSGGSLHVVAYDVATDGRKMAAYMSGRRLDVLKIVPSHLGALLGAGGGARLLPRRWLVLGGEALSVEMSRRVKSLGAACGVLNHYGPTEATVGALTHVDGDGDNAADARTVPIGRPIDNAQAFVLDAGMQPAALGVDGELYLGGAGLARGYLDSARQTAERFVPHPFSRLPGSRLYRTGDIARRLLGGEIEFVGRADHQVKVNGYRIELGEIESALKQHEGVRDAVAVVDGGGDPRILAYVVPEAKHSPTAAGKERYVLPNGMAVAQQNEYETDFFYRQIFVDQTNVKYEMRLPRRPCVFDVGANIGLFTLFASRAWEGASVYAFEPVPEIFELLRANASLYCANVKLYNCGLSDAERQAAFTFYPRSSSMSGYYADAEQEREMLARIMRQQQKGEALDDSLSPYFGEMANERVRGVSFQCRLRPLSDIIREEGVARIDLLKIDVEKSELDVLNGVADDDWRKIRNIVIEAHNVDGRLERLVSLLEGRGYRVVVEQEDSLDRTGLYNVYALSHRGEPELAPRLEDERLAVTGYAHVTPSSLRAHLQTRLPPYMLPSAVVVLDALPLTPNGKLDRRALPSPESARRKGAEYVAPRGEVEAVIVSVWEKVLGVETIGVRDDYFSLGGDSIRVIRIVYELAQCGVAVTAMDLFRDRTVERLARRVSGGGASDAGDAPPPLEIVRLSASQLAALPEGFEDAYPAARMQEFVIRHYAEDRQRQGVYHIQMSFHVFDPALSVDALKRAFELMIDRHPSLRTRFVVGPDAGLLQAVAPSGPVPIRDEDLTGLSHAEQEDYIVAAVGQDRGRPFDIGRTNEPLFRLAVFRRSAQTLEVFMSAHHAITDGWGHHVFTNDLVELYLALKRGEAVGHKAAPNTYKEFVALEREIIASDEASAFWREHLKRRRHEPPRERVSPPAIAAATNYLADVPAGLALGLRELGRELKVSLKAILLSSYLELLGTVTDARPVTVGVVSNGRVQRLSDPLRAVGLFWNIVPFCCDAGGSDPRAHARLVQQLLIDVEPFARYPLMRIMEDQAAPDLFWATFNFLHFHDTREAVSGGELRLFGQRYHDKFHFPLNYVLSSDAAGEALKIRVEYDQLYFDGETIRSLTDAYLGLLARVAGA
jgi:amino acid adenylation domain-containing protein/FkbM family methyltransferase